MRRAPGRESTGVLEEPLTLGTMPVTCLAAEGRARRTRLDPEPFRRGRTAIAGQPGSHKRHSPCDGDKFASRRSVDRKRGSWGLRWLPTVDSIRPPTVPGGDFCL